MVHAECSAPTEDETLACFTCCCLVCTKSLSLADTVCCTRCKRKVHPFCSALGLCNECKPGASRLFVQPKAKATTPSIMPYWQTGRPWLAHDADAMWCHACRAYPQPRCPPAFIEGVPSRRLSVIITHGKSGLHAVSMALWTSEGRCKTVVQSLPFATRTEIYSLFRVVYRMVKRS